MDKWQSLWDEPRTKGGRFVKDHSPFVSRIAAIYGETRSEQVFITRVRLDQLPLNKNIRRWKKHPTGKCTRCILHKAETVRHVLYDCPAYATEREEMFSYFCDSPPTTRELLNFDDEITLEAVMDFFKATEIKSRLGF